MLNWHKILIALLIGPFAVGLALAQDPTFDQSAVGIHYYIFGRANDAADGTSAVGKTVTFHPANYPHIVLATGEVAQVFAPEESNFAINIFENYDIPIGTYEVSIIRTSVAGYGAGPVEVEITGNGFDDVSNALTLTRFGGPLENSGTITGEATTPEGKAVGATVTVEVSGGILLSATTDANGQYALPPVPTSETAYTVYCSLEGYNTSSETGTVLFGKSTTINFSLVELARATIEGTVVSREANTPIEGATVTLEVAGLTRSATSDAAGKYTLSNLPGGQTFTIYCTAEGFLPSSEASGTLVNGQTKALNFSLIKRIYPIGTVPLTIQRAGNDLKISILSSFLAGNPTVIPDIYIVTGEGSGSFTNEAVKWTKVVDGSLALPGVVAGLPTNLGSFIYNADKSLTHPAQVGKLVAEGGIPEVYYKGLVAGTDQAILTLEAAVGKVDVQMHKGWNCVSVPFVGNQFGGATGIVGDNFGEGDTAGFWDYIIVGTQDMTQNKRFSRSTGWDNASVNIPLTQGCMFNISSLQGANTRIVTLIGNANTVPVSRDIYPKWGNIGSPYAYGLTNGGFISANVNPSNQLVVGDTIQRWGVTDFDFTIRYLGNDRWDQPLNFKPGVGYWFNHVSTARKFTWQP